MSNKAVIKVTDIHFGYEPTDLVLKNVEAGLVVTSHDRELLEALTRRTVTVAGNCLAETSLSAAELPQVR